MITANDVVRFFLELAAFAALGYWAWALDTVAWARVLIAVGVIVVAAAVWGVFRADDRAVVAVPATTRVVIEIVVFGAATAALWFAGRHVLAAAFGVLAAINEVVNYRQHYRSGGLRSFDTDANGK